MKHFLSLYTFKMRVVKFAQNKICMKQTILTLVYKILHIYYIHIIYSLSVSLTIKLKHLDFFRPDICAAQ